VVDLVLHIGAHRTGTTSLQQFLRRNATLLEKAGIQLSYPPYSRNQALFGLQLTRSRAVVSEENILGTMEENILTGRLYPSVTKNLGKHNRLLKQADKVFVSVRSYDQWWTSVIAFCASKGFALPDRAHIDMIAKLTRTWNDVVDDIVAAAPQAEIIVREFEWKRDTPKQQLNKLTEWPEWSETNLERRVHNRRASVADIAEALLDKGDFDGLSRLPETDWYQPFTSDQVALLREKYLDDIARLKARKDIVFWGDAPTLQDLEGPVASSSAPAEIPKRVFLHIGKTGGSFLKSMLSDLLLEHDHLVLCGHGDTLISTAQTHGRARKLAFLFRDPAERFVSGFNSRMRQGRPTYDIVWTTAEAASFSFFERPNDLAEALESADERLCSAAHFAFNSIFHLKHDYRHFLHSSAALRYEHRSGNILVCCETHKLESHLGRILSELGASSAQPGSVRNAGPGSQETKLSNRGLENLKRYLAPEYEIYQTCLSISRDLGFD
jgi:hypothetical protein